MLRGLNYYCAFQKLHVFNKKRKSQEEPTELERSVYYSLFTELIEDFISAFSGGDRHIIDTDFWWAHDVKLLAQSAGSGEEELDGFFDVLLDCLTLDAELGEMRSIVYMPLTKEGYREYEKKGTTWIGKKFVKEKDV